MEVEVGILVDGGEEIWAGELIDIVNISQARIRWSQEIQGKTCVKCGFLIQGSLIDLLVVAVMCVSRAIRKWDIYYLLYSILASFLASSQRLA